jgi:hypothetical protein
MGDAGQARGNDSAGDAEPDQADCDSHWNHASSSGVGPIAGPKSISAPRRHLVQGSPDGWCVKKGRTISEALRISLLSWTCQRAPRIFHPRRLMPVNKLVARRTARSSARLVTLGVTLRPPSRRRWYTQTLQRREVTHGSVCGAGARPGLQKQPSGSCFSSSSRGLGRLPSDRATCAQCA